MSSAPSTPSISVKTQTAEEEYTPASELSKQEPKISQISPVQEQELVTQTEEFTTIPKQLKLNPETGNKQESIVLTNKSQEPSMLS